MSQLQARINSLVTNRINGIIEKAIEQAIETALSGIGADATPAAKTEAVKSATVEVTQAVNSSIQDLADIARRAIRYGRSNQAFNKPERKLAASVIKRVKSQYKIVNTGSDDVWAANGLRK